MAKTFNYGAGIWATKTGSSMAYNDQNDNYKPTPFSVTRDSIATRVNKQGLIEVVGHDKLRIDYTDSSNGVALLEPSRQNKFLYSEDLTQFDLSSSGTGAANPTITSNYAISPDGTQNADRVQFNAGTDSAGTSRVIDSFTIFATEETISVYLKSNDEQEYVIDIIQSNQALDTVTITSEWQRFSFTRTNGSPDIYGIGLTNQNGGQTADILAWGFQLETGSYVTSYIPTSGSTVTRAADVANGAGNEQVFNDSEGVLFADLNYKNINPNWSGLGIMNSDGTIDRVIFAVQNNTQNFKIYLQSGGVVRWNPTIVIDVTKYQKIAVKYKSNDNALWINGFEVATDNTASIMPSGLHKLSYFGYGNVEPTYGNTKEIGYYDADLKDAELEAITSYTSYTNMDKELK